MFTGVRWLDVASSRGIDVAELPGLVAVETDDDADAGAKLSDRAARMAILLEPELSSRGIDLVISDVITVAGGWAAELAGIEWIELSPHPLYVQSRALPPIGAGLEPGTGWRGRLRDTAMRAASGRSVRAGHRQRAAARIGIGLPERRSEPAAHLIATLPALEVWRPDWPSGAHIVGPLLWEPTRDVFERPPGHGALVVIAPSTAVTGTADLAATALAALAVVNADIPVRVVISALTPVDDAMVNTPGMPPVISGSGRQDELLTDADLVICGGGHGMLAKSLLAGVPVVTVPGGGDQWELACRVHRLGAGGLVRPVSVAGLADAVRTILGDGSARGAARMAAESARGLTDPVDVVRRVLAHEPVGC